ncbi:AraC family transcriptional regulator N-terminal domain-containing protein [Bombella sp. ESL0385]|uniref:AraC family transcriptional regulator n=1 Tax=Bombella sp. ESL0385 TaxID=2676446 RepID=UPI00351BBBC6
MTCHCTGSVTHTAFDFLTLYRTETVTDPVLVVYEPRIYIVVQGEKVLYLHNRPILYDESHYLISTLNLPVSGQITRASASAPYLALCISFTSLEMRELLHDIEAASPSQTALASSKSSYAPPSPAMGLSNITNDILDTLLRLVRLLDKDKNDLFLAKLYKKDLLYHFLQGQQGHVLREIAHNQSDLSRINRALIHLRHHFHEPFEIHDLVTIAGMGQSSFYKRFSAVTGMTPVQYRTKLRLQEARCLMVHEDVGAAQASFLVGYESPSHFSRDYKRTFGRSPRADLHHIRTIGIETYKRQHEDVWF